MSHGQATGKEYDKVNLLRYFQETDRAVHSLLKEEKAPLILAAVDYLRPIYREANKYGNLVATGIKENPDELSDEKIHRQAWSIIEPYYRKSREDALKRYRELAGTGYSLDNLEDILVASAEGKVSTLFIEMEARPWGKYDSQARKVQTLPANQPGAEDLLDLAVVSTLVQKGTVYGLGKGELPAVHVAAAILRY